MSDVSSTGDGSGRNGMTITQTDMESRVRMANLRAALTDVLREKHLEGITFSEAIIVLSEMATGWARCLRADELKEEAGEVTE